MALPNLFAGSLFGAALTFSEVYQPKIIIDQLLTNNLHMLRVFLTATGASTLIIAGMSSANVFKTSPRSPRTLGLFSPYDANILGGALIGTGMALAGACPGTVLPQLTIGYTSAPFTLIGAILGGFLWVLFGNRLLKPCAVVPEEELSIGSELGLSRTATVFTVASVCLGITGLSTLIDGAQKSLYLALKGGLAIGGAQAGSILLTHNSIGSSMAYEEGGEWILSLTKGRQSERPSSRSMIFAMGALLGSKIFILFDGTQSGGNQSISAAAAVSGGVCLAFGARLAGGCTSGHGISGIASLSTASVVSVVSMFAGGMVSVRFV